MKYRSLIILTIAAVSLLAIANHRAVADDTIDELSNGGFSLEVATGYNSFSLTDVKKFMDEDVLNEYRQEGVPIATQRNFSGNGLIGLTAWYDIGNKLDVGIGTRYTTSPAKSAYKDFAGELEVTGSVRMVTLEGMVRKPFNALGSFRPFVGARGGLVLGSAKFTEAIQSSSYPALNGEAVITASGKGYTAELFGGLTRAVGTLELSGQLGYRYAQVKEMDGTFKLNGSTLAEGPLAFKFDMSGFTAIVSLSFRL